MHIDFVKNNQKKGNNKYAEIEKYCVKNSMENPKVSIIVPAYNVEKYIYDCLLSLVKQTFKEIEIIVINDGSIDNTFEIIEEFSKRDDRIRVINQKNRGNSCARNSGLEIAKGKYISFIDSDDWVDENYIEQLYNTIERSNSDIAAATIIRKRKYTQKYRVHYAEEKIFTLLEDKIKASRIPVCCYVWNKLYRAEKIVGHKFKSGVFFEDVLWLPEVIKNCETLVTVPGTNYYYRVNNASIVKKKPSIKKQDDSYNAKKYLLEFFKQNNLEIPKKSEIITRRIKYLLNIPVLKIKEYRNIETAYLFDLIPVFSKKLGDNNA